MAQNHEKIEFRIFLKQNISKGNRLHMDFFVYVGSYQYKDQFNKEKFMCNLMPVAKNLIKKSISLKIHNIRSAILAKA